jgi:soluble lytic murein transglycosylase
MPYACVTSVLLALCVCMQSLAFADDDRLRQALALQQAGQWSLAIQAIGTLDVTDTLAPALGRLLYLRGKLALQLQNTEAALHDFAQVLYTYPPLGDYAGWEMLQHYAAQDDVVKLYDTFVVLTRRYAFSRLLPDSYILLAQVLLRQAQHAQAQVVLEQFLRTYNSTHRLAPEALSLLAQSYADTEQTAGAAQTWQRLGESHPTHTLAAGALQRSVELFAQLPAAQRSMPAPEQFLTSLDALIRAQLWPEVEFRLSLLEAYTQAPSLASRVLLKRATAALHQRQLAPASTTLDTLLQRFPQGEHVAEAEYLLGQVAQRQGQAAESEQHYRRVMTSYPTSPWAAEALSELAALFAGRQQVAQAVELYERLAQDFPSHEKAADGLWEAGWGQYRQQHYAAAVRIFRRFAELLPHADMLPQVLYWQARALHQQGQPQVAAPLYQRLVEEYPFHYYSLQAANRLREAGRSAPRTVMAAAISPDWHPPHLVTLPAEALVQPNQLQFHFIRVQELRQLRMHREASREIVQLGTLLPDSRETTYFLSKLCVDNQDYLAAFRHLNTLFKALRPAEVRGLPRAIWTMLYPKPFWDEVEQQARATALDPYLVISIMRQESAFAPTAVSSAGARGLMQLMPGTAQQVSQRLQLGKVTSAMLEQPQRNIMLGAHYFASMLKRYEGNVVLALAAYNAGPSRADRWLKEWPATPQDEFIERIPFQETRLYVKLILRNMLNYERLYKALSDS